MKKLIAFAALMLPFAAAAQGRMRGYVYDDFGGSYGMMGVGMHGGLFGIWGWVMAVGAVLWLIVGGLLVVWLWDQISKKK